MVHSGSLAWLPGTPTGEMRASLMEQVAPVFLSQSICCCLFHRGNAHQSINGKTASEPERLIVLRCPWPDFFEENDKMSNNIMQLRFSDRQ